MYIIVVYDIASPRRGTKMLQFLRRNLIWVQNSVFEGEITDANFEKLISGIKKLINPEKDSVIYYCFDSRSYTERMVLGAERNSIDSFI